VSGSSGERRGRREAVSEAVVQRRRRFSLIWLIPIVAGLVAAYLGVQTLLNRGPLITIRFKTANGITAQETQVKYKSVSLGTVEGVSLASDFTHVLVHVRMNRQGEKVLTDHARFWVVRPRLTPGNISGLDTLISGAYIEVDPGPPGGKEETKFAGLEDPPGMRSDEPGTSYKLRAARLGSLGPGSPVFYRDVNVGEVLSYDFGDGLGPVTLSVFVRRPFDRFVHPDTHFWNASGLSVNFGAAGLHVELQSIQAILSGGVAFETPRHAEEEPASPENAEFHLFNDKAQADAAGYQDRQKFVSYFDSSVRGLSRGSAVEVFGLQIGVVDEVKLLLEEGGRRVRVRVTYELQPERLFSPEELKRQPRHDEVTRMLVRDGMRAVLDSSSLLTGEKVISLQYVPNASAAEVTHEGDALVIPSQNGGLDNIVTSLSDIATKIGKIPFEQIGDNLNQTLASVRQVVGGPQVREALQRLSATLADVQRLVRHADTGLQPVLQRLPHIADQLSQAVEHANAALGEQGYGGNSDFQRNIQHVLDEVSDAARSVRLLADFLDRHPEALIRGRTGRAAER
jgi:paraquat-inducible protein B